MWIDSDQVYTVNDFIKLLSAKKDIVSGLYLYVVESDLPTFPKKQIGKFVVLRGEQ